MLHSKSKKMNINKELRSFTAVSKAFRLNFRSKGVFVVIKDQKSADHHDGQVRSANDVRFDEGQQDMKPLVAVNGNESKGAVRGKEDEQHHEDGPRRLSNPKLIVKQMHRAP